MFEIGNLLNHEIEFDKVTIEMKKQYSLARRWAEKKSKLSNCLICGKPFGKPCNSHTVPQFVLRQISEKGVVGTTNSIIKMPGLKEDSGVKNFGTFKTICSTCDQEYFKEYESFESYNAEPSGLALAQIALKNNLSMYSKRIFDVKFWEYLYLEIAKNPILLKRKLVCEIDRDEYFKNFKRDLRIVQKKWLSEYTLQFFISLDYKVPIAYQGVIAVISGFNGQIINNIYNYSPKYQLQGLHLVVFPLGEKSVVFGFTYKDHKRYRKFFKEFRRLSQKEQLAVVSYLLFAYEESICISKSVAEKIGQDCRVRNVAAMEPTISSSIPINIGEEVAFAANCYSCENAFNFPNLLTPEYAIKEF